MATIVSIYPRPLRAVRPWSPTKGAGSHIYEIEAAPPDGYRTLEVQAAYQKTYYGEDAGERFDYLDPALVAQDLVNEWTNNRVGLESGLGPGVFLAAGPKPTKEELEAVQVRQEGYFEYLFNRGEATHRADQPGLITDEMRLSAEWLGRGAVAWVKPHKRQAVRDCPFCLSSIPAGATVCQVCHRDLEG